MSSLNIWVSCCDERFYRYFLNMCIVIKQLTLLCDKCTNLTVVKCGIFNTMQLLSLISG